MFFIFHCRTEDFLLPLTDANNEDLIKKNKKKKTLGSIHLKVTMSPITKEEMNEVCISAIITIVSFFLS